MWQSRTGKKGLETRDKDDHNVASDPTSLRQYFDAKSQRALDQPDIDLGFIVFLRFEERPRESTLVYGRPNLFRK